MTYLTAVHEVPEINSTVGSYAFIAKTVAAYRLVNVLLTVTSLSQSYLLWDGRDGKMDVIFCAE